MKAIATVWPPLSKGFFFLDLIAFDLDVWIRVVVVVVVVFFFFF